MRGIEEDFLPFITESIISFDSYFEAIGDEDKDTLLPNRELFEGMMKEISELYDTKGIESVLEKLPWT